MMQITDILAQAGGLQSMARELGVSESEATRGAEALAPAILGGFRKQADAQPAGLGGLLGGLLGGQRSGAGGLGGLAGMLDQDGNGNPLDDILRQVGRMSR